MLTIDGVTVRLGGRTIPERGSATVSVGARVGLIRRKGAGKSTPRKALIGEIEPDVGLSLIHVAESMRLAVFS